MSTFYPGPFAAEAAAWGPKYQKNLMRWLEANGIDPSRVVAASGIKLLGNFLVFKEFVVDPTTKGRKLNAGQTACETRPRRVRCRVGFDEAVLST